MRNALPGLFLLLILPASAQIYKYLDANGNPVFSNQPPEGVSAEKIELPPPNIVSPPPPRPEEAVKPRETSRKIRYRQLELSGVTDGEALRANSGSFSVDVTIEPPLRPGHRLQLLLDGQPYGQASQSTHLVLLNLDRGDHSLEVEVLAGERSVQKSAPVLFTLLRAPIWNDRWYFHRWPDRYRSLRHDSDSERQYHRPSPLDRRAVPGHRRQDHRER